MHIYDLEKPVSNLLKQDMEASTNFEISVPMSFANTDDAEPSFIEYLQSQQSENDALVEAADKLVKGFKHPDLAYARTILASTAINGNDDTFLPKYTWGVINTVLNTPFNVGHDKEYVIGHTYSVRALSKDGEVIKASTKEYNKFFDIETKTVLYKSIFPEEVEAMKKAFDKGEGFVSMEGKSYDFDYGLIDQKNRFSVVARNANTAFLTQHLRRYKGSGKYKDWRVVRILKEFHFSGNAWVANPANKRSVIKEMENVDASLEAQETLPSRTVYVVF